MLFEERPAGYVVFHKDDPSDSFRIILEGEIAAL